MKKKKRDEEEWRRRREENVKKKREKLKKKKGKEGEELKSAWKAVARIFRICRRAVMNGSWYTLV